MRQNSFGTHTRSNDRPFTISPHPEHLCFPPGTTMVLIIDTTYFDTYGVMVFRSWTHRRNVYWFFVREETNDDYLSGLKRIEEDFGYQIAAIVCDGKKGLLAQVKAMGYPVQLCQFHMLKTVTRYLTKHPKLEAGIELRRIVMDLKRSDEATFTKRLDAWHEAWKEFLSEKTVDEETGRWQYTHRRIRGAYFALRRGLPFLFTFEHHPDLDIQKTTNSLDGTFSHLKQKIHVHRGLNVESQQKMVETILNAPSASKKATRNVH
jgi:transposase-like protein